MLSKVSVRFALPVSDAKVLVPITCSVWDRGAGRVNLLVPRVSPFQLHTRSSPGISSPVSDLNEPTSVRDISLNDVDTVP